MVIWLVSKCHFKAFHSQNVTLSFWIVRAGEPLLNLQPNEVGVCTQKKARCTQMICFEMSVLEQPRNGNWCKAGVSKRLSLQPMSSRVGILLLLLLLLLWFFFLKKPRSMHGKQVALQSLRFSCADPCQGAGVEDLNQFWRFLATLWPCDIGNSGFLART